MECSYCKKEFSSKSILTNHQKTAKYCLKIQESAGLNVKFLFKCEFCSKNLSQKIDLERHQLRCLEKKESDFTKKYKDIINRQKRLINNQKQTIKEQKISYEEQIKNLQDKLENIAIKAVQKNVEDETTLDIDEFVCDTDNDSEEYKLQPLDVGNGFTIEHREEDGFINVTNLCKADKKQFSDWNELDETDDFLEVLSSSIGLPPNELIKYKICSIDEKEIWTHPQVAINIAQWISPTFDVKVSSWVYEAMMTGKVYITNTKSYKELQKENKNKDLKIQFLTKKYVKSQPRIQYDEKNVIYILTTKLMKKEGRYILGKAVDLTSRLSTYNKSDEHEVIFFASCKDAETMNIVENMSFSLLNEYREQANRERFILPHNEKIELFSNAIKDSIKFFSR
jgi:hypothetical protein